MIDATRQTIGLVLWHLAAERRGAGDRRECYPLGIALKSCMGSGAKMTEMNNAPKTLRMSSLIRFYERAEHRDERNTNRANGPCHIQGLSKH